MKVFIVEDEINNLEGIQHLIASYCKDIVIVGFARTVKESLKLIPELNPECILLDIKLPDGSGFDILQQLPNEKFKIIFTTAYDDYAIKAFKFSAIDYLLKPIDKTELLEAFHKVKLQKGSINSNIAKGKLPLPTLQGVIIVDISQIIRCEAEDNYTTVILQNNKKYVISKTMLLLEEFLREYGFIRCHRSHLINPSFITFLEKGKSAQITMQNGDHVPWSENYRKQILDIFGQL